MKKERVTLKDLSLQTGYSINTISRAPREKDDISKETIYFIKRTAEKFEYVNNTMATSLRSGYTNTIAVLYGDIANPFFANMMKEIEKYANQKVILHYPGSEG